MSASPHYLFVCPPFRKLKTVLTFSLFLTVSVLCAQPAGYHNLVRIGPGDSREEILRKAAHVLPSGRQKVWQELEFTVFIHFGMNTFTNREWGEKGTPASLFNPTSLDAEQWVRTAKMAGARLMILVAKHHDGFCLWPSRFTEYSVKNSPWKGGKGDVVAEVSAACKKHGMKLGIYLSPWDMNSPLYGTGEYNRYFKDQLTELLTQYGPVDEVWFDGACGEGPNGKRQVYDWLGYYSLVRTLQPEAVIAVKGPDVRWVGTESGYGRDTEWSVVPVYAASSDSAAVMQNFAMDRDILCPPLDVMQEDLGSREKLFSAVALKWYPSEVDVSIRPGWFYHADQDSLVKSPEKLVDIWYNSVGKNSVLLLNIPPDRRGLIHENDIAALKGMREILDSTFTWKLVRNTVVSTWDTARKLTFTQPVVFDCAMLQEDFRFGQSVESFIIEILEGNRWKEIARGTTIGYKRLLRFPPVRTNEVRMRVTSSRGRPEIKAFWVYKSPDRQPG